MLTELGFHDVGAAGCVHLIAGFATLGILINLGPRIGRFRSDGTAVTIRPHNLPLTMLGLMLIFTGFFGFLMGCVIYTAEGYITIYGTPMTLSAFVFNTLMGLSGGIIGAYISVTRRAVLDHLRRPGRRHRGRARAWTLPPGAGVRDRPRGGALIPHIGKLIEKRRIDDAVGAVAVHGWLGLYSLIVAGIFARRLPQRRRTPTHHSSGQLVGALVFAALGFIPATACRWGSRRPGCCGFRRRSRARVSTSARSRRHRTRRASR